MPLLIVEATGSPVGGISNRLRLSLTAEGDFSTAGAENTGASPNNQKKA